MKCGFKIGGGIDQDYKKSPQGYTDNVSYLIKIILFFNCTFSIISFFLNF